MKTLKLLIISLLISTLSLAQVNSKDLKQSRQCSAVTKSGERCKRKTTSPNGLCYQHNVKQATVLSKTPVMGGFSYKIHGAEDAPENWFTLTTNKDYKVGQLITTHAKDDIK